MITDSCARLRENESVIMLRAARPRGARADRAQYRLRAGASRSRRTRRLSVRDRYEPVSLVGQAGHAAQCALPPARVVPEPAAFCGPARHPDRQLVADADRLVPASGPGGVARRGEYSRGDLLIWLPPGGTEWVAQIDPVPRRAKRAVADPDGETLEVIPRLDETLVHLDRQAELRCDRLGGLDGSLKRRAADQRDVPASQEARSVLGHHLAVLREQEAGETTVENAIRVGYLAVPHEMNDCRQRLVGWRGRTLGVSHGAPSLPSAKQRRGRLAARAGRPRRAERVRARRDDIGL